MLNISLDENELKKVYLEEVVNVWKKLRNKWCL